MITTKYLTQLKKIIKARQNNIFIYKPYNSLYAKVFVKYDSKTGDYEALIQIYSDKNKTKEKKIKPKYSLKSTLIEEINKFLHKEVLEKKEKNKILKKEKLNLDDLNVEEKEKKKKYYSLSYLKHLKYDTDNPNYIKHFLNFLKNIPEKDFKKIISNIKYKFLFYLLYYNFKSTNFSKYNINVENIKDYYKYYLTPILNSNTYFTYKEKINCFISFLPISLNYEPLFLKTFNFLNKNITKRRFLSAYKNRNKPKGIIDKEKTVNFLVSNILKNYNNKSFENLVLISSIFLYHLIEENKIKSIKISWEEFKKLDEEVEKIYKKGLSINLFNENNTEIIFQDIKKVLKKYNWKNSNSLNISKAKIFQELNFFIEKYNNNLTEKLQKISSRIQKNTEITPKRKETLEKYIKGIKKLKYIPWGWEPIFKYHYMSDISNYEYPFEIKVYETLYEHYLLNSEIKKDNLKSKIKKIFFSNLFYRKNNEEDLKRITDYMEAEKRTIKYYKKMLLEINEEIEKTFLEIKEKFLEIGNFLLKENNLNLNLKKIILEYQEKYIIPLIKNNELNYTLLKNKISLQINYIKVLERKIKKRLENLKINN